MGRHIPTINVSFNRKCAECRKDGAADNGLCLTCTGKAIQQKPMKSENGRAVQARFNALRDSHR